MKVLCIGHAAYDITYPIERFLEENTKNRVSSRITSGGGPSATAAKLLGKWNIETYFMGIIGTDEVSEKIVKEFQEVNVQTNYLERNSLYETTTSTIIVNKKNSSRTILTYRPKNLKMKDVDIDFKPDLILLDGQEVDLSRKMIKKYPSAITVIDAGRVTKEIIELSKMVDYVVCSKKFAEEVSMIKFSEQSKEKMFRSLEQQFKKNIVITLEEKGCLYKKDKEIKIMPSIKVTSVDTTGAGDVFHGAFVYGLIKKFDFEKNLKFSNISGALATTKIGAFYSIPELEEVNRILNED